MERERVGNTIIGTVSGAVVQAGSIQQVVLPAQVQREELPVPRQLPPAVWDFTGREREIAVLDDLLPSDDAGGAAAVAVIDGAGGAGKTALVVWWAHRAQHRFPDGTLFVNLRGFGPSTPLDPTVVLSSLLPALGVAEALVPAELDAQAALYRSRLAGRRVLVVLDNVADAEQAWPLLPGASGCMVVMTSRDSLTDLVIGAAAHRISLDVLTPSESRMLLRGVVGPARVDAEPDAVAKLVEVCGGLPLAVRVAATRVAARPRLDIADVVAEIINGQDRASGDGSGGGSGDVGGALRSVFDWSYTRLPREHAMVLRRLGLHPNAEFGVAAVAVLTGMDTTAVRRCLEALADLHLVDPVGRKRYRMHDLVHAYAAYRARVDDAPEINREATGRLVCWYARSAQRADRVAFPALDAVAKIELAPVGPEIAFEAPVEALSWLHDERPSLVVAARRAAELDLHDAVVVLAVSSRFLTVGQRSLSLLYLEINALGIDAARASGHRAVEAFLYSQRGSALCHLGRWEEAEAALARALALAEELNDRAEQVFALSGLGRVRAQQDRLGEARTFYQQALPLAAGLDRGRAEAVVLCNLSQICTRLGEYRQALEHADQELVLRRQAGDRIGEAYAYYDAALAWQGLGDHDTAISLCQQAIETYRAMGNTGGRFVDPLLALATSLQHTGNVTAAAEALREAVDVLTQLEDPRATEIHQRLVDLAAYSGSDPSL